MYMYIYRQYVKEYPDSSHLRISILKQIDFLFDFVFLIGSHKERSGSNHSHVIMIPIEEAAILIWTIVLMIVMLLMAMTVDVIQGVVLRL